MPDSQVDPLIIENKPKFVRHQRTRAEVLLSSNSNDLEQ